MVPALPILLFFRRKVENLQNDWLFEDVRINIIKKNNRIALVSVFMLFYKNSQDPVHVPYMLGRVIRRNRTTGTVTTEHIKFIRRYRTYKKPDTVPVQNTE